MAFPLHVTTPATHVNHSSPLPNSAYFCSAFPKRGCNCKIAKRQKLKSRQAEGQWPHAYHYIKTRRYDTWPGCLNLETE